VPGDKSISHRAVLFAAMAEGTSRLSGVLDSADVRATIAAVSALGASVKLVPDGRGALAGTVTGWGASGSQAPTSDGGSQVHTGASGPQAPIGGDGLIDCGNSGTTARLLMGALAGWPVRVTLTGDASLTSRPMRRVTEPLSQAGAQFVASESGTLPVAVVGTEGLKATENVLPVASAQVKGALILAGLRAHGRTRVTESAASRNHTELMLPAFGVPVGTDEARHAAWVDGPVSLRATDIDIPGDPSSAAFMAAAVLLVPSSEVRLTGISLNPTRMGFFRAVRRMGAHVVVTGRGAAGDGASGQGATGCGAAGHGTADQGRPDGHSASGPTAAAEPVGDVHVAWSPGLHATEVTPAEVPSLVDEIPALALLATQAAGTTRFTGIGELRVKESDRLTALAEALTALGAQAKAGEDWLEVTGPCAPRACRLDALGDHRLAMCWALAGLIADGSVTVAGYEAVETSYPTFADDLGALGYCGSQAG